MPYRSLLFWLIQCAYLFLMGLALYFYEERLSSDTSYYFFKSLNTGFFHVEHQRWVLALAELPVVLLSRLGLPLSIVAQAYSLGHVLFFYFIGWYVYHRYRNVFAWLLLLLLQLIGIREGFIGPVFEQFYGTALSVWFYLHLREHPAANTKQVVWSLLLYLLILSSHPFNGILVWFLLALHTADTRSYKRLLPYLLTLIVFIVFKKWTASEYESGKMNWIFDLEHNKTYLLLFDPEHLSRRFVFLISYYPDWCVAFGAVTTFLLYQKRFLECFLFGSFLSGSLLLINFSYSIEAYSRYNEQVYYLIVPLVLFPLLLHALPTFTSRTCYGAVLLSIIAVCCFRFAVQIDTAQQYETKVQIARQLVERAQEQEGCTFYVAAETFREQSRFVDWDLPYFTLLYSAMHHYPKQVSVLPVEGAAENVLSIQPGNYWFRGGEAEPISQLNSRYFKLCTSGYSSLKMP